MSDRNPPPPDRGRWDQRQAEPQGPHRDRGPDGQARDRDREREREQERERRSAEAENYRKSLNPAQLTEYRDRNRGIYICFQRVFPLI